MAIVLQHSVALQAAASANSITGTAIVPAGTNRYGLVKVAWFSAVTISSVVWGGVDITANLIKSATHDGSSRKLLAWFYYLDPPASSANIVVTFSGNTLDRFIIGEAWDGVDQATPYSNLTATADGAGGGAGAKEITVSSAAGSVVTDCMYCWSNTGNSTLTPDGSQTSIQELEGANANGAFMGSSYEAGAASVAMTWTFSAASSNWASYGISLNAASGGGGGARAVLVGGKLVGGLLTRGLVN